METLGKKIRLGKGRKQTFLEMKNIPKEIKISMERFKKISELSEELIRLLNGEITDIETQREKGKENVKGRVKGNRDL